MKPDFQYQKTKKLFKRRSRLAVLELKCRFLIFEYSEVLNSNPAAYLESKAARKFHNITQASAAEAVRLSLTKRRIELQQVITNLNRNKRQIERVIYHQLK
jgi:hypothetical protein